MKLRFTITAAALFAITVSKAQNTFPATGNVGIGTLTPSSTLHVVGTSRFGGNANNARFAGNGSLSLVGTANYLVSGNRYVFQYATNNNYGLLFNSTDMRYEFLDAAQRPVFRVHADNGQGFLSGGLQISNSNENLLGNMRFSGTDFEGYDGSAWKSFTGKTSWGLKGNAGTNPASDFIGTTDNQPLKLKAYNVEVAMLEPGLYGNTALGFLSLYHNTTGEQNVAHGSEALYFNTTGNKNIAFGDGALYQNLSGSYNTAIGSVALYANTTGTKNIALGFTALSSNTTGSNNISMGSAALYENTTGYSNIAIGEKAIYNNTTGSNLVAVGDSALFSQTSGAGQNTAIGSKTLYKNTTGAGNTAAGSAALYNNVNGSFNVAVGLNALKSNNNGYNCTAVGSDALGSNFSASGNTGIGKSALGLTTTGEGNTATGFYSMSSNTTGAYNLADGSDALGNNTSGNYNTASGYEAGYYNETGSNNTFVGYNAGVTSNSFSNSTALGNFAPTTASNQVRIGNSSVTSIGGYKAWTNLSDGRVKKNIKANVPGLAFINLLKPVTYNLDLDAADNIMGISGLKDKTGKTRQVSPEEANARKAQQEILCTGFIAQEVEASAKKLGYDFEGVDVPKNNKDLYGLRYSEFVVPLVKAVQELSKQNDALATTNDALKKQNNELEARMQKIEALLAGQTNSTVTGSASLQKVVIADGSLLEQNIPNPFKNITTINYTLPQKYTSAKIVITDKNGKIIKQVNVSGVGKGTVQLDAANLSSGSYQYALLVDGKLSGSKQMVVIN